jgi:hypothetical protein
MSQIDEIRTSDKKKAANMMLAAQKSDALRLKLQYATFFFNTHADCAALRARHGRNGKTQYNQ